MSKISSEISTPGMSGEVPESFAGAESSSEEKFGEELQTEQCQTLRFALLQKNTTLTEVNISITAL